MMDRRGDVINQHFESKRKLRSIKVSTDDFEVRMHLRQLKYPICCFGEDEADRRERLRQIIVKSNGLIPIKRQKQSDIDREQQDAEEDIDKAWYHEGSNELLEARKYFLEYGVIESYKRRCRIKHAQDSMNLTQRKALAQEHYKKARELECVNTITCAVRPLSSCQFSPDSKYLATGSWDGNLRIFNIPDMDEYVSYSSGHSARMSSVAWNPKYGQQETMIDVASSDHDGIVKFWSTDEDNRTEAIGVLEGMEGHRVGKLGFHPSGDFLATPSYDKSWRLWDLSTGTELLVQEGHTGAVTDCKFHSDGSLIASCDMDGYARVWDIRSGRCVFFMEGHAGPVLCCDWSSHGVGGGSISRMIATGSEDGYTKLWDLRTRACAYTISSHDSSVTAVRFQQHPIESNLSGSPHFLCTASIDRTARLWAHPNWTPLTELSEHAEKVMSMDLSGNGKYLATAAHNRNIKLWQFPE